MHPLSRVALACSTGLLLAACAKGDQAAKDSAVAAAPAKSAPAAAMTPAPSIKLADVAGKWNVHTVPESGTDTTPTDYVLTATPDTTGWLVTFKSGLKVPVHVSVAGDSVINRLDTFSSQRRKGMKVSTNGWFRLEGGKLTGSMVAHYVTKGADSVLHLRSEGTRIP